MWEPHNPRPAIFQGFCNKVLENNEREFPVHKFINNKLGTIAKKTTNLFICVVVNFLFQVIFVFLLFLGMVIYADEVETKEK